MLIHTAFHVGRPVALLLAVLALLGCQTAAVVRDYDLNRDFTQYRDWRWADPAVSYAPAGDPRIESDLTTQRVRDAVSGQLDVRGLRPAVNPAEADLQVKVYVISELRKDNVTTSYGGFFGGYWGGGWGGGPGFSETRSVDYQVLTLQIDLLDGRDGQLVWRGSDEQQLRSTPLTPVQRSELIQTLATRILGGFPP
ncbi:MAG: DUF4136 domain-containing protein [Gammaproteobacteria bacterium HGW-Gammaproteobacteria-11]|nr:MAG: DUF4136 domain-containing protein [Gammaproteobacteria bacterium HGW-Gammaproteobacteria-11]